MQEDQIRSANSTVVKKYQQIKLNLQMHLQLIQIHLQLIHVLIDLLLLNLLLLLIIIRLSIHRLTLLQSIFQVQQNLIIVNKTIQM